MGSKGKERKTKIFCVRCHAAPAAQATSGALGLRSALEEFVPRAGRLARAHADMLVRTGWRAELQNA
jgi:hypothetical protein